MLIVGAANLQKIIESVTKKRNFTTFAAANNTFPMKKAPISMIILAVLAFMFTSCTKEKNNITHINYADPTYWYSIGDESREADVFYVYPTVATVSYEENDSSWYTDITLPEVREEANSNQKFNKLLYYEYNFYAPYYRQMIFDAYRQPKDNLEQIAQTPFTDIEDAFQYYMTHYNHGRPFFLVGHSQGSQMLIELLKNGMTKKQRQQMVAAYCIGFQITDQELAQYPEALKPAVDSCMQGVVIFNSVSDIEAASPLMKNTVVGINPLTWTEGTEMVDQSLHLGVAKYNTSRDSIVYIAPYTGGQLVDHFMVCSDFDSTFVSRYYYEVYADIFPYGNLHFADSWLFGGNVVKNMRCRLRHYNQ